MEASLCPSADLLLDWRSRLLARRMCRSWSARRDAVTGRYRPPGRIPAECIPASASGRTAGRWIIVT